MHIGFDLWYALFLLPLGFCFFLCPKTLKPFYVVRSDWFPILRLGFRRDGVVPFILFTLLVLSFSSPYLYRPHEAFERKGRALVLALDSSGSMGESRFDSANTSERKFDALIEIAKGFILGRYDDNVGVVVFGTFAYGAAPITYDMRALAYVLETLDIALAGENTTVSEAIVRSLELLKQTQARQKVIVLLTDGYHNTGSVSIASAVAQAQKEGVRIYTIGIGKPENYDQALLKKISQQSGAKHFGAQNKEALKEVFEAISALEPSPIRSASHLHRKDLVPYLLIGALALIALMIFEQRGRHEL